ncbi:MAG: hypothetical protein ACI9ZV_000272 [Candidatus Azotimanducaceae bacterium]|jgi:hypothetical protein
MDFDSVDGEITSFTGTRNFVIIPSTIDGRDVNIIGESAFADNNTFFRVKVLYGVDYIESAAFKNCRRLKSFYLPNNLNEIGDGAFSDCIQLSDIQIPESVTKIGSNAFSNCRKLSNIKLPKRLKRIESNTFHYCTNLEEIMIPPSVRYISLTAFKNRAKSGDSRQKRFVCN